MIFRATFSIRKLGYQKYNTNFRLEYFPSSLSSSTLLQSLLRSPSLQHSAFEAVRSKYVLQPHSNAPVDQMKLQVYDSNVTETGANTRDI